MTSDIHVLHVDDNAAFRDLTAEFLERSAAAIAVRSESDPEAVLERVEREPIDCVVSDMTMPGRTGIDLCEEVRANHPQLPFVLFTNRTGEAVVTEALTAGVTDYVRKETGAHHYKLLANRIVHAVTRHRALVRLQRSASPGDPAERAMATPDVNVDAELTDSDTALGGSHESG